MGWKDVLKTVATVAPEIASMAGVPGMNIAKKIISNVLTGKEDSTESEIEQATKNATPDQWIEMTKQNQDFKLKMRQMDIDVMQIENTILQGQVDLNKLDAQSGSLYKGGWRPFIGWVCGFGFSYAVLVRYILTSFGVNAPTPDTEILIYTLFGMLGIGGLRTAEKFKGVAAR